MKEEFINKFMTKLIGKIPDECLTTVKRYLVITLGEYEISRSKNELVAVEDNGLDILNIYLGSRKIEGLADTTLNAYKRTLTHMLIAMNKPIKDITTNDIRIYLYKLESTTNISKLTLNSQQSYIKAFFSWLMSSEYINKNPTTLLQTIKHEVKEREPISDIDMEKMRLVCRDNLRDKALLEFLYSTGARVSEARIIKISDLDFVDRTVKLFGKGKKHRISYLNARAIVAINEYLQSRKAESEYLFVASKKPYNILSVRSIEKIICNIGVAAGVQDKVFPHRIRHTTATDAIAHGMDIEELQKILGHADISTSLIYAKIDDSNIKQNHQNTII